MSVLGHVTVLPFFPKSIERLNELAHNLYWTWTPEARALFRSLDPELWERSGHNPVVVLREISQERLKEISQDKDYLSKYQTAMDGFDQYLSRSGWFSDNHKDEHVYAYFCAEYGWHEAVALYSGGLGVLAGDHTKAASDLGVPLVGVGLWYQEGYFHQRVAEDGQQEAVYETKSPYDLPLELMESGGKELRTIVTLQGREVQLRAWKIVVGQVPIYLLDTNVPENHPEDRGLLRRLYGGDQRTRIAQEVILGIGGVRMLRALGISPTSWHMNEGHSAFMALERCRELVAQGMRFDQAREVVSSNTIFTVHTPVAAGNDAFAFDLVTQYFGDYWGSLGLDQQSFLDLGCHDLGWGPIFSMPALAIRFSSGRNGVAELHGETTRKLWNPLWPDVPTEEVPIDHVTNGVHVSTWVAPEIQGIVSSVLPKNWFEKLDDDAMWEKVHTLDNAKLWEVRKTLKAQSIRFLRRKVLKQLRRHGASAAAIHDSDQLFDPNALTIGFARRFATYKRATLIFKDLDRLAKILGNPEKPVQLVFAGKAHPADKPGQELISVIHNLSKDPRFAGKILFVEDYDMAVGRALTRGADVWLNNPRRPLEASGTSGQKAAMNGMLNLSILDGWWPEGFNHNNGWAIGDGQSHTDEDRADLADVQSLYELLENEVVPLYYARDDKGVPQAWMDRAKDSIATVTPKFNAARMVKDYVNKFYAPASERMLVMQENQYQLAADLASWRRHLTKHWPSIYFSAQPVRDGVQKVGETIALEATLHPHQMNGSDLRVEVVYSLEADELKANLHKVEMNKVSVQPDGAVLYQVEFEPEMTGRLVYGIRVFPVNPNLVSPFDANKIHWVAEG